MSTIVRADIEFWNDSGIRRLCVIRDVWIDYTKAGFQLGAAIFNLPLTTRTLEEIRSATRARIIASETAPIDVVGTDFGECREWIQYLACPP